ncbi:MAG: Rid family hydrolase [Pseudomonadales bacterium]|nr:Rid family hydrolase [Pseudomonadales bacterium]
MFYPNGIDRPSRPSIHSVGPRAIQDTAFSDAVIIGDLMNLSGQVGTKASNHLVKGGLVAKTHQIFWNMQAILITQNLDLSHLLKRAVMMNDISR